MKCSNCIETELLLFLKELREHASQNKADWLEDGDRHAKGFADAQLWAEKRLKAILRKKS